ncbi:MAG: ABC transporter permease [Syntrophaceticus sp.]
MRQKTGKNFIEYFITIWVVITLNFILPRLMPGDPFLILTSQSAEDEEIVLSEEQREFLFEYYGLDQPIYKQYLNYLGELVQGNMGFSVYYKQPVSQIVLQRLPWSIFMVLLAVFLSTFIGTILGCISAWHREKWIDKSLFLFMITFSEIPSFLLGLILLIVFAAGLGWFPLAGAITHFADCQSWWERTWDVIHHAFLPSIALTMSHLGGTYLLGRNSMTTVLEKDYLRTAWAKGLPKKRIIFHHALKNALLPIVTRVFLSLGALVGGAILVENIFSYPGLGTLMRESVRVQDYPVIQGIFLVVTICVLLANFFADVVYRKIDPRVSS